MAKRPTTITPAQKKQLADQGKRIFGSDIFGNVIDLSGEHVAKVAELVNKQRAERGQPEIELSAYAVRLIRLEHARDRHYRVRAYERWRTRVVEGDQAEQFLADVDVAIREVRAEKNLAPLELAPEAVEVLRQEFSSRSQRAAAFKIYTDDVIVPTAPHD